METSGSGTHGFINREGTIGITRTYRRAGSALWVGEDPGRASQGNNHELNLKMKRHSPCQQGTKVPQAEERPGIGVERTLALVL